MQAAALVISIVSLVVAAATAGLGLVYTRRADSRDRLRVQREEAAARASLEARPTAALIDPGHDDPRSYRFQVVNIGHAAATDLEAVLIDDSGTIVSRLPRPSYVGGTGFLNVDERVEFELPLPEDSVQGGALFLHFTWSDSRGTRQEHTSRAEIPPL
jgi:hypothetical protein